MTDAQGFASAEWTLGPSAGANMVEAQVPGVGAAPFTATADPDSGAGGAASVDRLVFLAPPRDVERDEFFSIKVALVDDAGDVVPLSGIFIYVEPFRKGDDFPTNDDLRGERFENTENGIAEFEVAIEEKGEYRLRALTDDLPDLGPHGPEPHLFSDPFEVD